MGEIHRPPRTDKREIADNQQIEDTWFGVGAVPRFHSHPDAVRRPMSAEIASFWRLVVQRDFEEALERLPEQHRADLQPVMQRSLDATRYLKWHGSTECTSAGSKVFIGASKGRRGATKCNVGASLWCPQWLGEMPNHITGNNCQGG